MGLPAGSHPVRGEPREKTPSEIWRERIVDDFAMQALEGSFVGLIA